jgi:O-antigen ligase
MAPHSIGGITGLNPLNLLLFGTLGSWLMRGRMGGHRTEFSVKPMFWLYVLPFLLAGAWGVQHVSGVAPDLALLIPEGYSGSGSYVVNLVVKPLFIVLFALLVAVAAAHSDTPERLLMPMLMSLWVLCLMTISFVLLSGADLAQLSSSGARTFLSPLGLHANDLGRLYAIAYALLLFTLAASPNKRLNLLLACSMALVILALTVTFSRGAFLGFVIVNALFLISRRHIATLLLGIALLVAMTLILPGAVFERIATGWGQGLNEVSSGRVDEIWLPLLPEIWNSPLIGNGIGSIGWSQAMRSGLILTVGHAHNAYLGTLLDMGIIGLTILGAWYLWLYKGFRALSREPSLSPLMRGYFAGAAVGLAAFLLTGFAGSSLTPALEQIFLWMAVGMLLGHYRRPTSADLLAAEAA